MRIPLIPMTSDADNNIMAGQVYFDVFVPKMKGPFPSTPYPVKGSEEKATVLVMDVKGLQRRNLNDVLLKRLKIRGARTWFLTHIESVDDIFDAFNTDAESVLFPVHTVRSATEMEDIRSVSDSSVPAIFVRKGAVSILGGSVAFGDAVERVFGIGYHTVAVMDTDGSMSEGDWSSLADSGGIIPCSFTGRVKEERLESLGFENVITVPR